MLARSETWQSPSARSCARLIATPVKNTPGTAAGGADRFVQNHQNFLLLGCRLATEGIVAVVWSGWAKIRRR